MMALKRKHGRTRRDNGREIIPVNATDADWTRHRYILWFGAYGTTRLMVWANSLDDALDGAIDWLVDNAPGHIVDDQVNEAYEEAIGAGKSEDEAREEAESDTTIGGNAGNHILSHEWGIVKEDPSRADLLELEGRPRERRSSGVDLLAKRAKAHRGFRGGR